MRKKQKESQLIHEEQVRIRTGALQWIHQHFVELLHKWSYTSQLLISLEKEPYEQLPNLLLYGPQRMPLEYMAYAFLKEPVPIKRKHLWDDKMPYFECERFFEIQCNHPSMPKNFDILCDFMKHILISHCIHDKKHVIILRDIDIITQSEYHYALRVLLERFSHNVMFIATTHHISKIESPLQSRFMMIRIPQPPLEDIQSFCLSLAPTIDPAKYIQSRDILSCLFRLYLSINNQEIPLLDYDKELEDFLSKTHTFDEVRQYAYKIFQRGVSFQELCYHLIDMVKPAKYQRTLVFELAKLEHSLAISSKGREPIYYEKALWMATFSQHLWKSLVT